jgi:hypothetical protein
MLEGKIRFKNIDFELWCHPKSINDISSNELIKIIIKCFGDTDVKTNPYLSPNSLVFRALTEKGAKIIKCIRKEFENGEKSKTC